MKNISLFLVLLFAANYLSAQNVLSWKIYSDMRSVVSAEANNSLYFAATTGGMFFYDSDNGSFVSLTKVEGLSSHNLTSMTIDSNQKVWITTTEGIINVYNYTGGGEITRILDIYNSDKNQKQINHITSSGNKVYVSSNFGISILDAVNESFDETIVRFGELPTESKVNSTFVEDKIYLALDAGVAIQKNGAQNLSAPESWDSFNISLFGNATAANAVVVFNGIIYAGTNRGLFRYSGTAWESVLFEGQNIAGFILENNLLYIALDHSVYTFDGSVSERIFINNAMNISSISLTENSRVLVSSDEGLWVIGSGEPEVLIPDGPASNTFMSVAVDNEGNLWAGSGKDVSGAGVFKFDGTDWENFNTANTAEFNSNAFHRVYAASDGSVYLMNWGQGYTKFQEGVFETVDDTNSPLMGITEDETFIVVTGVQFDSRGNLWVLNLRPANRTHLNVLTTDGIWYQYSMDTPYLSANVEVDHFVIDAFDTKWFAATEGGSGLYYFNENGTFDNTDDDITGRFTEQSGLRSSAVTSLAVDTRGEVWIGNTAGVNYLIIGNPESISVKQTGLPLWGLSVNAIAVDPMNRKWVGTNQGLFLMTTDAIQTIEQYQAADSPLLSDDIKSIAIDERTGNVYVGTDFGLMVLETTSKAPAESYDELLVFPNPFYVGSSYSVSATIDGLMTNSTLKVLTVDGKLVTEFESSGGRQASWNGRDSRGEFVSSGIYIIVAYDEEVDNVATAKIAVFNK